jgi:hypothetical protein
MSTLNVIQGKGFRRLSFLDVADLEKGISSQCPHNRGIAGFIDQPDMRPIWL